MSARIHFLQEHIEARTERVQKLTEEKPKTWEPLTPDNAADRLAYGAVLAFDQTLSSCGMVLVKHDDDGLRVTWSELIRPDSRSKVGFWGTYNKALDLHDALWGLAESTNIFAHADEIVHEMPSTGGHRTESSLLAGFVVQQLAQALVMPCSMIANISMRALLVSPEHRRDTSKAVIRRAIDTLLPDHPERPWNEHTRDATGLALTRLMHRKIAENQEQQS